MFNEQRYNTMKYRRCGTSGLKLPLVSLGFWNNFSENDSFGNMRNMVFRAFDLGITHFDLANNYGPPPGSAEKNFGRIIKESLAAYRDELIISSKAGYTMWPGPYGDFGSRKYIIASADQSLKRMGIEYFDIFYSHRFDPDTPLEETALALDSLVRQGKALYIGVSNYNGEQLEKIHAIFKELKTPFIIHQPKYNIINRTIEQNGAKAYAEKKGLGTIVFSPLQEGLLSNKYFNGIPADSRGGKYNWSKEVNETTIQKLKELDIIAKNRNQTLAQMALSWVLKDDYITSVLIGASKTTQIEENVKIVSASTFTPDELSAISKIHIEIK